MPRRRIHQFFDGPDADAAGARRSIPAHENAQAPTVASAFRWLQRQIGNRAVSRLLSGIDAEQAAGSYAGDTLAAQPERASRFDGAGRAQPEHDQQPTATASRDRDDVPARKPAPNPGNGVLARTPSPVPRGGVARRASAVPGNGVARRKVQLDGTAANLAGLLAQANDMKERVILANWDWSETIHNFESSDSATAQEKLEDAVASAKSQAQDVPALYSAANLAFLTKGEGRLPTLYFIAGTTSGRIRQQHGSGPAVISQTDKVDYFFESKNMLRAFQKAARAARKLGSAFAPNLAIYHATTTPTAGYFHFEVTYSGAVPGKLHPSGGIVDTAIGTYDDTKIQVIYNQAVGLST